MALLAATGVIAGAGIRFGWLAHPAAAQDADAKLIATGDSGQLPSVQTGGWMREVGQRVGAHL